MQLGRARDAAHGARADTPILDGFNRVLLHLWAVGQAQVIIRTEIQHPLAIHGERRALGGRDGADGVIQPLLAERRQLIPYPLQFVGHRDLPSFCSPAAQYSFEFLHQRRQLLLDSLPHDIHVDIKVAVNQTMAHSNRAAPRQFRISMATFSTYLSCGFADNLNILDDRQDRSAICIQLLSICLACKLIASRAASSMCRKRIKSALCILHFSGA